MYDPKGGDKPAYDPPAETPPYGKPPTEPPPYQKPPGGGPDKPLEYHGGGQEPPEPPTDYEDPGQETPEEPDCDPPASSCECTEWPLDDCPPDTQSFRRLLLKLQEVLDAEEKSTDATKKFADDLKDADKEYQGIVALVNTYKKYYDKLDCELAKADSWKKEIDSWVVDKPTAKEKQGIDESWQADYEDKENQICCGWIQCRDYFNSTLDCLEQAKKKEDEAKENYEAIKNLEKTLSDRFKELETLYDKAKAFRDAERFKALYAVSLEFGKVNDNLSLIRDWFYARGECDLEVSESASCPTSPAAPTTNKPKDDWKPEKFKAELARRLRLWILAKYQKFRWWNDSLTRTSENDKMKEACEKFRKERREQFIQEAEDVPEASNGGGNYSPTEPPPGGETPEYPPTTEPYPGQQPEYPPRTGQYPAGQQPEYPPPAGQYPGGQKNPETPAPPADEYRGRTKR